MLGVYKLCDVGKDRAISIEKTHNTKILFKIFDFKKYTGWGASCFKFTFKDGDGDTFMQDGQAPYRIHIFKNITEIKQYIRQCNKKGIDYR